MWGGGGVLCLTWQDFAPCPSPWHTAEGGSRDKPFTAILGTGKKILQEPRGNAELQLSGLKKKWAVKHTPTNPNMNPQILCHTKHFFITISMLHITVEGLWLSSQGIHVKGYLSPKLYINDVFIVIVIMFNMYVGLL